MNCWVNPAAMVGFAGVTAMDTNVAVVTVKVVDPVTLPLVALMVVLPTFKADARPVVLIVAVAMLEDAHVTLLVRFCVLLSLYVPVAVNCWVSPAAMVGLAGVTAMDSSVAVLTVSVVEPDTLPLAAVIRLVPTFTPVARPAALMVAFAGVPEVQITLAVRFCVELSE